MCFQHSCSLKNPIPPRQAPALPTALPVCSAARIFPQWRFVGLEPLWTRPPPSTPAAPTLAWLHADAPTLTPFWTSQQVFVYSSPSVPMALAGRYPDVYFADAGRS
uniref:Uncharacterized protein n=1 Tax=Arundo donax TaxID=35708 RepID=A0A0A9GX70_ARUDO